MTAQKKHKSERLREIAERLAALPEDKQTTFVDFLAQQGIAVTDLPIVAGPRPDVLPLSYAQRRVWTQQQLAPGSALHNVPNVLCLRGPLDVSALARALAQLVARHESLRTTFHEVDGEPSQRIHQAPSTFELSLSDLCAQGAEPRQLEAARAEADREAQRPIDLQTGPLCRASLLKLGEQEHWLLMTLHHIATDEWSDRVLTEELVELYAAACAGRPVSLPALALQYADYALWQRRWMQGARLSAQLDYWTEQLESDGDYALSLPYDQLAPVRPTFTGDSLEFSLDAALTSALRELSARHGVTLFMTLLGTFQLLLARYTGRSDVRVGVPIANRHRSEVEPLIGFFANTQVLRADVHGGSSLDGYLAQIKRTVAAAQENQDLPFEQLVDALRPERSESLTPLFQVLLSWHRTEADDAAEAGELQVSAVQSRERAAKFDLTLHLTDTPDGIDCQLIYRTELYAAQTISTLAERFTRLARELSRGAGLRLAQLEWLSEAERAEPGARASGPGYEGAPIAERIAAHARAVPEQIALQAGNHTLTYGALECQAGQIAAALQARGVRPGSRVGLLLPRSPEQVLALYAVLKCGAAYVPLDPKLPLARRGELIQDAELRLIIAHEAALSEPSWITLGQLLDEGRGQRARGVHSHPEQAAYVIFTSGSTGRPKGVEVTQRNLSQYVDGVLARMRLALPAQLALVSTVAADLGHTVLFGALATGSTLHTVPDELTLDADRLVDYLAEHRIDVLKITPSHFGALLHAARPERALPRQLLVLGGESTPPSLLERIRSLGQTRILNHYGPTETTVGVLTYELPTDAPLGPLPLGRPLAHARAYVLDADLRVLPSALVGELYIGGAGVARGYLGRPELSADRFVPNPFAQDGSRLYRTGDRARMRQDGELEFLGRVDDQLKIRGHRVELGEIEAQLGNLPELSAARVGSFETSAGALALVAYLVPRVAPLDEQALRTRLSALLPEHMVPSEFVWLESIPLTANGKLDRKSLPAPRRAGSEQGQAPRSVTESLLCEIWRELLKRDAVGIHDNFFRLGGDSLLAFQVIARARREGLYLTPAELFTHQTIAELSRVVSQSADASADCEPEGLVGAVAPSPMQRAFFQRVTGEAQHWNQSLLMRVTDERIGEEMLERAFQRLAQHHDALRMRFVAGDSAVEQSYGEQLGWPLVRALDLGREPEPLVALQRELEEAQRSLDLAQGRLLAVRLLDLGAHGRRLFVALHHLVVDGVSWRVLAEDLSTLVDAELQNSEAVLPAKTSSFQAWTARLAQYAESDALAAELPYWQRVVRSAAEPRVPAALAGENTEHSVDSIELALSREETRALLTDASRAYRTQVNDLLLTALALTVSGRAEADACLVELEGHGRQPLFAELDLSRTVGWFTSLHPVRLWADPAALGRSIQTVKEALRATPKHGVGYGILRELSPHGDELRERSDTRALVFNYLGQLDLGFDDSGPFPLADESTGEDRAPGARRDRWFDVVSMVQDGCLTVQWSYSRALHQAADVQLLAEQFIAHMRAVIEHCCAQTEVAPTPSDYPLAPVTQDELTALCAAHPQASDLYGLSSLQEGILFHALSDAQSYITQRDLELDFAVDAEALERAFQRVVAQHDTLRTGFAYERSERPVQLVYRDVKLPFEQCDLRGLGASEQVSELARLLERDRARGFDLTVAPLMRVTLLRLADARYRLLWSEHHLLLDGWSCARVLGEVFDHYRAYAAGVELPHESGPQFKDYLAWLAGKSAQGQAFWRTRLQDFERPSLLAHGLSHAQAATYGTCSHSTTPELLALLRTAAQSSAVTLNTLLQGALALVISNHARTRDVVFAITSSGRSAELAQVERIVGLFINTVPLRVGVDPGARVADYLQGVQRAASEALGHAHTPLVEIQRASSVRHGTPLFDVLMVFENYLEDGELAPAAEALGFGDMTAHERTNYPLTVQVSVERGLTLQLDYQTSALSHGEAETVLGELCALLPALASGQDRFVGNLPLLSADARQQALGAWNDTRREFRQASLPAAFEAQVERSPDSTALAFGRERLSYRALNERANRLAHSLLEFGLRPEQRVAVYLPRSIDMVVALLAIMKAGGAYVPLDPEHPIERVRAMLNDSAPALVLSARALADRLGGPAERLWVVDEALVKQTSSTNLSLPIAPGQLAYCIYTSGSTGTPKAVAVTHDGLVNFLDAMAERPGIAAYDRVLALTPLSFDIAALELYLPLLNGARVVLIERAAAHDPAAIFETVAEQRVTVMQATPASWKMLTQHEGWQAMPALRVLTGGEALPPELARALCSKHTQVSNVYGPTETTVWSSLHALSPERADGLLGHPIANTSIYVLGPALQPLPSGVVGELYIAGRGLARGYLGRSALTAERFVPNPFAGAGERMYRTGDLASHRADGTLAYHGRSDFQVKIRGFRIELGEIESQLREVAGVRDALVADREVAAGVRQLVAYVVPEPALELAEQALREQIGARLKLRLPEAMVPRMLLFLPAFPLTSSGKVDRRALPEPLARQVREPIAARTDSERALARALAEVLELPTPSVLDNFFELGGDSISALRWVSRARSYGYRLRVQDVFAVQTVERLAALAQPLRMDAELATAAADVALTDGELSELFEELE